MNRRRRHGLPFAAYAALLFNASLCVAPFIAARAVSTAYGAGEPRPPFEASSEAIQATRQAIENRFQRLTASGEAPPREVWAGFVREELEAGDMTTVNGLLLAAPAMLGGDDGDSLKARIAVADTGGEDQLVLAALAYLPEDVQETYEKRNAPIISKFDNVAASPVPAEDVALQAADGLAPATPDGQLARDGDEPQTQYNVLGDLRDLALQASRWAREDRIDEFAFTLAGVGLTLADAEAREGASIVLSARRAQRLDPKLEFYLQRKLFLAAPPQRLKRLLVAEFQSEFGYVSNAPVIEGIFKSSADRGAVESLSQDLRIIQEISRETSPSSAVTILSQVRDGSDLRRARLVAEAGGDRAVALASYDGEHFLDTARTVITWNNALRLQLLGLVACLGLLLAIALNVLWRSFMRDAPVRRSAVYALDEPLPR
ncbi:MAG: hypothetical protein SGJ21_11155 [Alphaproteobacteria bacterium]|nr:hypothetical protein [Alphaproteobacteria bacterium]